MIKRVDHVHVVAKDMGQSIDFYTRVLGFRLVRRLEFGPPDRPRQISYVGLGGNPVNIRQCYQHPAHMVGSDALLLGRWPNPRSHGTYPMVLGQLCRDEGLLTLPEAVRKMTSRTRNFLY